MSDPTPPADGQGTAEGSGGQEPADEDQPRQAQQAPSLVARYGLMRSIGRFDHDFETPPAPATKVVIRTTRGVELGEVVIAVGAGPCPQCIAPEKLAEFTSGDGGVQRQGKVLRLANPQDIIDHRHLEGSAQEERAYCRQQIRELDLNMKVICVEHLLGGERIIFYFTAEGRVDFRELVRRLAAQYRTRIEMRQVGARDEARLLGDYERCGLRCCCQEFLKDLKPVSMRMAKTQKATLDPTKISGRCGRLMCCLRYEDACYEDLRKRLPPKNIYVRTADLVGRVVETQILTQLVKLELPDGAKAVVATDDILERDVTPPAPGEPPQPPPKPARAPQEPAALAEPEPALAAAEAPSGGPPPGAEQQEAGAQAAPAATDQGAAAPTQAPDKKKRRRRRRRRKPPPKHKAQQPQPAAAGSPQPAQPEAGQQPGARPKKKRRRRRRKKKR